MNNLWQIIDATGCIFSGEELETKEAFKEMSSALDAVTDGWCQINFKGDFIDVEGDIVLVEVHDTKYYIDTNYEERAMRANAD